MRARNVKRVSSLFLALLCSELLHAKNETLIEEVQKKPKPMQYVFVKDKAADQTPGDAAMLYNIPGLNLTETSGPLGFSPIQYRGLSGARFPVDLEGLSLYFPQNGMSDGNGIFLFAAESMIANAQSLSIMLPTIDRPKAKFMMGYGSHHTAKIGLSAGTPVDDYSTIFGALQMSSTRGNFSFRDPDLTGTDKNYYFTRENNDQHRLQGVIKYQRDQANRKFHALFAYNGHEGGVPGYAFSPTKDLRSEAHFFGFKTGIVQHIKEASISFDVANSVFLYETNDIPKAREALTVSRHEFSLGLEHLFLPSWLDLDFEERLIVERAYQIDKTRIGGGLFLKRDANFSGKLKPSITSSLTVLGFNRHGFIRNQDFYLSIEPFDFMNVVAGVKYSNRLPTFMELYANNRFITGNENLNEESIWDIELGANIRIGEKALLKLRSFMGFINDTIVYVPHLAIKKRPINTGTAKRYGIDMSASYEPWSWLLFDTNNSVMGSRVKSTNDAPLPGAPNFLGHTKIRFGREDFLSVVILSRYRSSAYANIYGTLKTHGYILFDAIFAARLREQFALSFSISNIFHVTSARDSYEMPLPGTIFYGQIEIGNMS